LLLAWLRAAALIGRGLEIFGLSAVSLARLFDALELIQPGTHAPFCAQFFSFAKHCLYEISQRIALFFGQCVA
jgi:hypothetical protein